MKPLVLVLIMYFSMYSICLADSTILTCKSLERVGRSIDKTDDAEFKKILDDKFHKDNRSMGDLLVITQLDTETPIVNYSSIINGEKVSSELQLTVLRRTENSIVLSDLTGIRSGMVTLWLKEKRGVYFYSEEGTIDLSFYVEALDCQ